jgi:hypothetical protein
VSSNATRIRELCEKMDAESVFHLSLHSKELFHSNIIAWFCEKYPSPAKKVFEKWASSRNSTEHRVLREHKFIDLIIELPGLAPIVIENKVFAPIDEMQLIEYAEEKELKNFERPDFVCLSLGAPTWKESGFVTPSGHTWVYLSYQSLATGLADVVEEIGGFDGELLKGYVRFVQLLQNLAEELGFPDSHESITINDSIRVYLQKIRMHDAFDKLRSRSAMAMLEKSLKSQFDFEDVEFKTGFTNGEPLMEAFVPFANGDRVGWQLQGIQWRLAVKTASYVGSSDESIQRRHDYVATEYSSWFDFSDIPLMIAGFSDKTPPIEKQGGFNRFNPDFVHRYRKIPGLTIAQLRMLSTHYIKRAIELRGSAN